MRTLTDWSWLTVGGSEDFAWLSFSDWLEDEGRQAEAEAVRGWLTAGRDKSPSVCGPGDDFRAAFPEAQTTHDFVVLTEEDEADRLGDRCDVLPPDVFGRLTEGFKSNRYDGKRLEYASEFTAMLDYFRAKGGSTNHAGD